MSWKYYNPKFKYEEKFEDSAWAWTGHKYFAYDLIANIKPKKIVELGTHYGTSLWSFSQAVKDQQIDTEINAVDTWKGEAHAGIYGEEVFETVNDIKNKFYSELKINLIRKTFDDAVSDFEDNSVDILHIDGLHTYEAVRHDFENWLPKVKQDGIIILHDIRVKEDDFGVYKLWEELKEKYSTIEFFQSFGLGVLFLDKNISEEFEKNEKEWQMHYSYIHEMKKTQSIYLKDQIIRSEYQKVKEKNQKTGNLNQPFLRKDQEIINLNQIVYAKDQEKQQCEKKIEQLNELLQKNEQIIEFIQSSKFWKLRKYYLKFKFLLFYPIKTFSKNEQRFYSTILHPIKFFVKYSTFFKIKKRKTEEKIISIRHDCNPSKKTIIFIDNNVPTYDKDAGSRTIYQYVKLFLEINFNVVFIPDDFSPRQPYTRKLEKLGVKVLWSQWYLRNWNKWLIDNTKEIDYFFLNRSCSSFKYLQVIKNNNMQAKVIYYPVDITYIREIRQYEITKEEYLLKDIEHHKKLESFMFKKSDVVVTISEYEKDVLKKEFPETKVFIIPTFIYDHRFPITEGKSFEKRRDILFVGGFKHLPNADGIKWFINSVFPLIKKEIPHIKINIIGSHTPDEISNLASPDIKILGFVSDKELEENYSKTRIVVAPLRYGAGVKGKIIESIAYGVPVVTTEIGAEGIINKENILLIGDNEKDFAKKVVELYSNSSTWQSLRNCQIEYAKLYLSKESAKKIVKGILNKV